MSLNFLNCKNTECRNCFNFVSAPDVTAISDWDLSFFSSRVAINNAWQVTPNWDYLIFPEDFPIERRPKSLLSPNQQLITATEYVRHQNNFGGFIYAGGTMAFTAGYWALSALKPDIIAYIGCDMVYPGETGKPSHFYGRGTPDPLRKDMTLQSLEAKSNRLMAIANTQNCVILNLSSLAQSRLTFPRLEHPHFQSSFKLDEFIARQNNLIDLDKVKLALAAENHLGYVIPSGRYWESNKKFEANNLKLIDSIWLEAFKQINSA